MTSKWWDPWRLQGMGHWWATGAAGGAGCKHQGKRWLKAKAATLAGSLLVLANPVWAQTAAPGQGLGVWFTTVDSQVLFNPQEAQTALKFLEHNGFQRATVPLYSGGYLYWQVAANHNPLGVTIDPQLPSPTSTKALLEALGARGMGRVGWLEFGLMAPADAPWLQGHQDLLLQDNQGSTLWQESPGLNRVWLNPALPAVREALVDWVVDACTTLPVDAIQLDDHLGYPVRFGYDPATLALWRQTAQGAQHPQPSAHDPDWIAWRADQVTGLLAEIRAAMASQCPRVKLSVAPNPQDFSKSSYLADWSHWIQLGLVDEVVVQIYRNNPERLAWELAQPSLQAARRVVPLRIGLLAGLKSQPKETAELLKEVALTKQQGLDGIDFFFYESARHHFSNQEFNTTTK